MSRRPVNDTLAAVLAFAWALAVIVAMSAIPWLVEVLVP